jgi:predicted alpha-1,6-mannanase (GH76 family)
VSTLSSVYPADDGYLYFRGTDGLAWRLKADAPSDRGTPGDLAARSGVFADDGSMYFQGRDFLVWRYAFTDGSLADYATAAVITLQNWYDQKAGLWNPRLFESGWWNSANALYALIDYMSLTGNRSYLDVATNTFRRNRGGDFLNNYYDDEGWWALAWVNAYDLTGEPDYLNMAKTIFADMEKGWDPATCGGGVLWKKRTAIKNSIENELFLAVAARLYQRVPDPEKAHYLEWLQRAGQWFYDRFVVSDPRHLIADGLVAAPPDAGSHAGHEQTYTYTQGVILGALVDMAASGLDFAGHEPIGIATQIADAAIAHLTEDGVLTEYGAKEAGRDPDRPQFKGIFMRNLGFLAAHLSNRPELGPGGNTRYVDFIRRNAAVVLESGRTPVNQFGYRWQGPLDSPDSTRQTSALEALNAALRAGIRSA